MQHICETCQTAVINWILFSLRVLTWQKHLLKSFSHYRENHSSSACLSSARCLTPALLSPGHPSARHLLSRVQPQSADLSPVGAEERGRAGAAEVVHWPVCVSA